MKKLKMMDAIKKMVFIKKINREKMTQSIKKLKKRILTKQMKNMQ